MKILYFILYLSISDTFLVTSKGLDGDGKLKYKVESELVEVESCALVGEIVDETGIEGR